MILVPLNFQTHALYYSSTPTVTPNQGSFSPTGQNKLFAFINMSTPYNPLFPKLKFSNTGPAQLPSTISILWHTHVQLSVAFTTESVGTVGVVKHE